MPDVTPLYQWFPMLLPLECMEVPLLQQALLGLLLLAPMAATMGVQVVNFRMAFFTDAISHSAFAGVALGLIFAINPHWTMPLFGMLLGLCIMAMQRRSALSSDTVIGVFFSAVVAFGIAMNSREPNATSHAQQFLYGDILSINNSDIWIMIALFALLVTFQYCGYNRLLYIGLNPVLAKTHRVRVAFYQYTYTALLSLIVIFSVQMVGILLATALFIVPAASARNIARSAGSMVWWALFISTTSAIVGFIVSCQEWAGTATGATVILVAFIWFLFSVGVVGLRGDRVR